MYGTFDISIQSKDFNGDTQIRRSAHALKPVHAGGQTADELADVMARVPGILPEFRKAWVRHGMANILSAKHTRRELIKGGLPPVGRFRGPMAVRANASTLRLFGPGLTGFADWQVRVRALLLMRRLPVCAC